ncbi:Ribosomal protein L34 domain containing protein [Elaphomyces granulatus]
MKQPSANRTFSSSISLSAPRKTFRPSRRVQKRRHGFLARLRTRTGQAILKRRRAKGRKFLSW